MIEQGSNIFPSFSKQLSLLIDERFEKIRGNALDEAILQNQG
jgi:hypothetical protein